MPVLAMLGQALAAIVADTLQTAGKEAIMKAINDNLDDAGKKLLDDAINEEGTHGYKSLDELL